MNEIRFERLTRALEKIDNKYSQIYLIRFNYSIIAVMIDRHNDTIAVTSLYE